jgi:hypothetical protein
MLIGAVHLLYTDADDAQPSQAAVTRVVNAALAGTR